jgi:hypothetical protein
MRTSLLALSLLVLPLLACGGDDSPSAPEGFVLSAPSPVEAVEGSSVDCATFPVTITDVGGEGGDLDYLELTVLRTSDSKALGTNRRPNVDYTFAETYIFPRGTLVAEAGLCWDPVPAGTGLEARVTAGLRLGSQDRPETLRLPVIGPRDR